MLRWFLQKFGQREKHVDRNSIGESPGDELEVADDEHTISVHRSEEISQNRKLSDRAQVKAVERSSPTTRLSWPAREEDQSSQVSSDDFALRSVEQDFHSESDEAPTKLIAPSGSPKRTRPAKGKISSTPPIVQPEHLLRAKTDNDDEKTRIVRKADFLEIDDPVVGWLVIIEGPGKGRSLEIGIGANSIGRAPDQKLRLDFGDTRISRERHAILIYDPNSKKFILQNGETRNLTYIGNKLVIEPMNLKNGEMITIGDTKLSFVAFCGPDFNWI